MRKTRIYVDLDQTLITSDIDQWTGEVKRIYPRVGVQEFLEHLAPFGQIWILTKATRPHLERAMRKLGPDVAKLVSGAITREDMEPVEDKVEAILTAPISSASKRALMLQVKPIFPRGVIFDNEPAGDQSYILKTTVVGAGPSEWIEVEPFDIGVPDLGGLERAFSKFLQRRRLGFSMKGAAYA